MIIFFKKTSVSFAAIFFVKILLIQSLRAASISESTEYPDFCQAAADNDEIFANFKRDPSYRIILEHVSFDQGIQCLDFIIKEYPEMLHKLEKFRQNDLIGNPITYDFGESGWFSPTTLRYMKIAGDLKKQFHDLGNLHIVEIGGGYGGQCKIINDLGGFASYTIIDLPQCNALSKKYLSALNIKNVKFIDNDKISQAANYDLVISNYAFSEIDREEQMAYINAIIGRTPNGYMTINFISESFNLQSLSVDDLMSMLLSRGFKGKIEKEFPITNPDNLLITWHSMESF